MANDDMTPHDTNTTATATATATTTTTITPGTAVKLASTRSASRPKIVGGSTPETPFPIKMSGTVIKGFGRGSKELGIPTANLPEEAIAEQEHHMETGIYYGWAQVVVKSKSIPSSPPNITTTTTTTTTTATTSSPSSSSTATGTGTSTASATETPVHPRNGHLTTLIESAASSSSSLAIDRPATVYPMVMSLGWNPYYKNEKKSAEVHIMHNFHRDFYGDNLRVVVLGYIRPELDYTTLEALIEDINIDIEVAHRSLARPDYAAFKDDPIFQQS